MAAATVLLLLVFAGTALASDPIATVDATATVSTDVAVDTGGSDCSSSCGGDTTDLTVAADLDVTANAAVELYDQRPSPDIPGAGRVRDAQVGVQFQRDLGTLTFLGAAAVAGTYYFQYQSSPAILNVTPAKPFDGINLIGLPSTATQVFATKGTLHVAQLRLTATWTSLRSTEQAPPCRPSGSFGVTAGWSASRPKRSTAGVSG